MRDHRLQQCARPLGNTAKLHVVKGRRGKVQCFSIQAADV